MLTSFASIHLNNQFSVKVSTSHQENDDEEGCRIRAESRMSGCEKFFSSAAPKIPCPQSIFVYQRILELPGSLRQIRSVALHKIEPKVAKIGKLVKV